jgi:phosphodiesterase/alkaline phosphatase D-like protein
MRHRWGSSSVQVGWQVAADPSFRSVLRSGSATARPGLAHSVHVDVRGLRPGRDYWYRFKAGRHLSQTGHTRTAPAHGSATARLRFGIANCQDWQNGFYPAYRDIAAADLDLVLHLGDYIYEYDPSPAGPRQHNPSSGTAAGADQLLTLADFRNRHALYRTDPQLRAAHLALPFVSVWDDHETENNYAGLHDEQDDLPFPQRAQDQAQFAVERANAYQAWFERTPVRASYRRGAAGLRIYRRLDFGTLLRLNLLDTRQYRTDQPGGLPTDFGPPGPRRGQRGRVADQAQAGGLAAARAAVVTRAVERARPAGDDGRHPLRDAPAHLDRQPRPVGRVLAPTQATARRRARQRREQPGDAGRRHPLDLGERPQAGLRRPRLTGGRGGRPTGPSTVTWSVSDRQ